MEIHGERCHKATTPPREVPELRNYCAEKRRFSIVGSAPNNVGSCASVLKSNRARFDQSYEGRISSHTSTASPDADHTSLENTRRARTRHRVQVVRPTQSADQPQRLCQQLQLQAQ